MTTHTNTTQMRPILYCCHVLSLMLCYASPAFESDIKLSSLTPPPLLLSLLHYSPPFKASMISPRTPVEHRILPSPPVSTIILSWLCISPFIPVFPTDTLHQWSTRFQWSASVSVVRELFMQLNISYTPLLYTFYSLLHYLHRCMLVSSCFCSVFVCVWSFENIHVWKCITWSEVFSC